MPACAVMSVNSMGPEGRVDVSGEMAAGSTGARAGAAAGAGWVKGAAGCTVAGVDLHPASVKSATNKNVARVSDIRKYLSSCCRSSLSRHCLGRTLAARLHPDFDQHRRWSHDEECIEWRVDDLIQTQNHFEHRYEEDDNALSAFGSHGRLGISNHEEDKELIHRSGNGRDLGQQR